MENKTFSADSATLCRKFEILSCKSRIIATFHTFHYTCVWRNIHWKNVSNKHGTASPDSCSIAARISSSCRHVGISPPPCWLVANKGLGWDSLQKMFHNPGDCYRVGGRSKRITRYPPIILTFSGKWPHCFQETDRLGVTHPFPTSMTHGRKSK